MEIKKSLSLQSKFIFFIIFSMCISILLYFTIEETGNYVVEKTYLTNSKMYQRRMKVLTDFKIYVEQSKLKSTDYASIKRWCDEQSNVYIMMFLNDKLKYETNGEYAKVYNTSSMTQIGTYGEKTYPIQFRDKIIDVALNEYSENDYYSMITVGAWVSVVGWIIVSLLFFIQKIIKRITRLSESTRKVKEGDEYIEINTEPLDEIGQLGQDIVEMRNAIVNHYEKEQEAWIANKDLITSLSHDIRTPLTSLIAYSEILTECDGENTDVIKEYARVSCEKAYRLKYMTDQLFQYFLVYGNDYNMRMEEYGVDVLLAQMIGEYSTVYIMKGFQIENNIKETQLFVKTDAMMLRRVFDNVFSNIGKYALKGENILINSENGDSKNSNTEIENNENGNRKNSNTEIENNENGNSKNSNTEIENNKNADINKLKITISNAIDQDKGKAESTKIGLKTCEKIMSSLGGDFSTRRYVRGENTIFEASVVIPVYK